MASPSITFKAIRELGPKKMGQYALYQAGLRSGYYRFLTRAPDLTNGSLTLEAIPVPSTAALERVLGPSADRVVDEAREIAAGSYRQWGGKPVPLRLSVPGPLAHWTAYESGQFNGRDIKYTWEPARFGWALSLARAYILTGEAQFSETFHRYLQQFLENNPPYRGPNWASAQEVAIRLIALVFAFRVFSDPPPNSGQIIAMHAARIPPTLLYARAQNNNHLLSEAVGLYTAGTVLADHPRAVAWRETGWRLLNSGLQTQISEVGAYMQQSTNYHRLMLQLALCGHKLSSSVGQAFPKKTLSRMAAATRWLLSLADPQTGKVPNLGPNDGAYILPLSVCGYDDYRPVLQAAANAFLGEPAFEAGPWDEMGAWVGGGAISENQTTNVAPLILTHPSLPTRAFLRAARLTDRPGHADQLHVDLWWRGINVAHDPGTYLYNAAPPWQNALSSALHHNTITIDGHDQMTRAGRFLYVDRAQASILSHTAETVAAEHDGYRALGIIHRRTLEPMEDGWKITDFLDSKTRQSKISVHWQLPDWPWEIEEAVLRLESPHGWLTIDTRQQILTNSEQPTTIYQNPICSLIRAGKMIFGSGSPLPTQGWYSPTYGVKMPALCFTISVEGTLPETLITEWRFPKS